MTLRSLFSLALIGVSVMAVVSLVAQQKFELNETQKLKLENAQLKAYIARRPFEQAVNDFVAVCDSIKKENKWPSETVCDLQSLNIIAPPVKSSVPEPLPVVPTKK